MTASDAVTGNGNTFPEPGETVALTVPLTNLLPTTATGVAVTINGVAVSYPDIAPNQTVTQDISYLVPAATPSERQNTRTRAARRVVFTLGSPCGCDMR